MQQDEVGDAFVCLSPPVFVRRHGFPSGSDRRRLFSGWVWGFSAGRTEYPAL